MEKLPSWQTRAPETFTCVNGGGLQRLSLEVICHLAHPGAPYPRVVAFQDPCRVAFETYGLSLFGGREQAARHLPKTHFMILIMIVRVITLLSLLPRPSPLPSLLPQRLF